MYMLFRGYRRAPHSQRVAITLLCTANVDESLGTMRLIRCLGFFLIQLFRPQVIARTSGRQPDSKYRGRHKSGSREPERCRYEDHHEPQTRNAGIVVCPAAGRVLRVFVGWMQVLLKVLDLIR